MGVDVGIDVEIDFEFDAAVGSGIDVWGNLAVAATFENLGAEAGISNRFTATSPTAKFTPLAAYHFKM